MDFNPLTPLIEKALNGGSANIEPTPTEKLIMESEGFETKAYKKGKDRWTVGYGSTFKPDGTPVKEGDTITEADAKQYLRKHMEQNVNPYIDKLVKVPLNDNQRTALSSLIYNIGGGNFQNSQVLKKLNQKDYAGAAKAFANWGKGAGKEGLLDSRRQKEMELFLKSTEVQSTPAPVKLKAGQFDKNALILKALR